MIFLNKNRPKVFCIGSGKTGTTSVERALKDFGYKMGNQVQGELLINDYANRNFKAIIDFCKTAEAFQDAPFCFQHTYMALDQYYRNSKFILTERDSDDQWYNSLVKFHSKRLTGGQSVPTWEDLKQSEYRFKGYSALVRKKVFGIQESEEPYHEIKLKDYYNIHNASVKDYFKNKNNLLVLNLSETDAYTKMCEFLGKKPLYDSFPWENKTSEIK